MSTTGARRSRRARVGVLAAAVPALVFSIAACSTDEPTGGAQPPSVSIAPSSAAPPSTVPPTSASPTSPTPSSAPPTPGGSKSPPGTDPSIAQSETIRDAAGAVQVAESAVADGTAVEVSGDDGQSEWAVTVRTGAVGRELRIAQDKSVVSTEPGLLSAAQRGELPEVTILDAIGAAQQRHPDGVANDAELTTEDGQRVWDVSVDVASGTDWELWIDPTTGTVVHEERD